MSSIVEAIQEEKPFAIIYTSVNQANAGVVSFACTCGTPNRIIKQAQESILSATFCPTCDEQWSIRWSEGLLCKGILPEKGRLS